MNNKSWQMSRRTALKGVGVVLGLPLLDAMTPLSRAVGIPAKEPRKFPTRLAVLYMANGVRPDAWTPTGAGKDFNLSPILSPLEKFKDDLLVFTELWNPAANTGDGHYVKTGGFLTSTTITRTTGSDVCSGGVSMDQIAAQKVGNFTRLPSLELGIEATRTFVDKNVGFTTLYGGHISWSTPITPAPKEVNPQLAFDRLFRPGKGPNKNGAANRSVLDAVLEDAKRLQHSVGKADQIKLNEYFESIRAIERRIEFENKRKAEATVADPLMVKAIEQLGVRVQDFFANPNTFNNLRANHTEHVRLMLDIMALGFWSDTTRICTFMFGNAVSGRSFSWLDGVSGGHHEISHHKNEPPALDQYQRINTWHIAQYAYLLEKLKSIKEGESNVLDNSMILCGAGLRDGNAHSPRNLPLVMAGKAGGQLATGRHLVFEKNTKMSGLHRGILKRMGASVESFADSDGELPGLSDPDFKGTAA